MVKLLLALVAIAAISSPSFAQAQMGSQAATDIKLISARYGSNLENLVPVTESTLNRINSGAKIIVSPSIATSDPAMDKVKYLYIELMINGVKSAVTFRDGETADWAAIYKKSVDIAKQLNASTPKSDPGLEKPVVTKDKDSKIPFDPVAFRTSVDTAVNKLSEDLENPTLGGSELVAYSRCFRVISDNPELEKTMGVSREWYLGISKMLSMISTYRMEYEIAEQRNLVERQLNAQKALIDLNKKFKHLLDHPMKIKKK